MSAQMWNRVAQQALCQTLGDLGSGLANAAAWSIGGAPLTGGASLKPGLVMLGGAGAANLTYSYGCSNDPSNDPPPGTPSSNTQCPEVTGCGWLEISQDGVNWIWGSPNYQARKIGSTYKAPIPGDSSGTLYWFINWTDCEGNTRNSNTGWGGQNFFSRIVPQAGSECVGGPPPPAGNPGPFEPITITDQSTNCTSIVQVQGFVNEGANRIGALLSVTQAPDQARAGGGVIGGCNWGPTNVYLGPGGSGGEGGGQPPINFPAPPENTPGPDGKPPWLGPLQAALAGAAGALTAELIEELTEIEYPSSVYRLTSVCEKNEAGEPVSKVVETVIPAAKQFEAVVSRLDAIVPLLQGQKDFKQPICESESETPEGDFRTISFRSVATSPYGKSRLRKRFRYRSVSGNDLGAVVDHWKDFSFTGGPYRVRWSGGAWGTVEVWAATENEGKRLIRHAAAEAGFDPFKTGRWSTRLSSSTRLGVPLTMSVDTTGGYYWITARDGSDNRPIVAKT